MKTLQQLQVDFTPNAVINLENKSNVTQQYEIQFGEYGSIIFDALVGSSVVIKCGTMPPTIHLLETEYESGIQAIPNK